MHLKGELFASRVKARAVQCCKLQCSVVQVCAFRKHITAQGTAIPSRENIFTGLLPMNVADDSKACTPKNVAACCCWPLHMLTREYGAFQI